MIPVQPSRESLDRMQLVLANYLLACSRFQCPGMDGASLADVVASEYPAASAAGWVPRPAELTANHPDLADVLQVFFRIEATGSLSA
jgi:hypothetical protein